MTHFSEKVLKKGQDSKSFGSQKLLSSHELETEDVGYYLNVINDMEILAR